MHTKQFAGAIIKDFQDIELINPIVSYIKIETESGKIPEGKVVSRENWIF